MSMEHRLAKLNPRSAGTTPGSGGVPELTAADIAAALGFSVRSRQGCIGTYLVMARCADDAISHDILPGILAKKAWGLWFELGVAGRVSPTQIRRLAEVALIDYTEPGRMQNATPTELARQIPVDPRTWMAGLGRVYAELLQVMADDESRIFSRLYWALAKDG